MALQDLALPGKYLCHQAEVAEDAQPAWGLGEPERALDPVPNMLSPLNTLLYFCLRGEQPLAPVSAAVWAAA